ncbi:hypothetical protein V6N11_034463 [Hibiscus sabdariffa]|uniref:Uncharacterized protein n=2 Tax=Hibiscus sabdariffa TaxID=183260 RepID=A0ABR1ZQ54_9ROSI
MEKIIDPDYICYPTIVAFIEEIGIPKQNIEYLSYLEPGLSLDGGLRNLGTENHNYLELIKHLENEGSAHIYVVGDFREIDEDEVRNNDVGPNIGEVEVVGLDGVENNEDGHVLGETEVVGLVGVENNEDVHVLGETEATGVVGVENNDDGHVLGESEGVRPVLGERGDGDNEGSKKVGRYVNADSNDITTDTAKSDEDDDSESKDLSAEGWLTNEDDEEISQIFNNKRKFKSRNLGDEHQEAQPKRTATDSQRKESSVEDETSDIDYIESDDPGSYETDSEGELCVKKGKKLFFNDKGEVPRIELGMIFENSNSLRKLWVLMLWSNDLILGDFKGEILATVGRDENNQIFPVTWAVVEVENRETWAWFLEHIQIDLEIGDGDRFTIFSELQKSQQTQDSTSLQPEATDVSQPPAPNPSQPATTDVSQPLAPNPSQPGTSQASQPQFPNSGNTSTKIKGKASC